MMESIKVLLVDDDNYSKYIIQHHLKRMGITQFVEANDGESAMAKIKDESFSLIIADRYMPGIGGIDFFKSMQEDDALKNIPFLMITMESDSAKMQEARDAGIQNYLVKPISAEGFEKMVRGILNI
ncbi:hypothetical protein UR09_02720 [Candidatus Nitromaritima sp. SCGC AAA799-A02]|nr:hypothetical protein UR09_02720 [Candidatus Nitromaritima sp. SCGC AAA799-A02]